MKLQDFRKFRDTELIQPQRTQIMLDPFVFAQPVWAGASIIVGEFSFGNTDWFSLKLPVDVFGANFIPCVRYVDTTANVVYRYKLFDDARGILFYPVYAGERLGPGTILEIWTVNSSIGPSSSQKVILESSELNFPTDNCGTCCVNSQGQILLVPVLNETSSPNSYCSPFCLPLQLFP